MQINRWVIGIASLVVTLPVFAPFAMHGCIAQERTARKTLFALVSPPAKQGEQTVFEDRLIKIEFTILSRLSFKLTNKSTSYIELDWDRAAYVDMDGLVHRVVHQGIRLIERDRAQPPTAIPAGSVLEDFAHPVDYVKYADGNWQTRDLLPVVEILTQMDRYEGKSIQFLLPLTIGSTKKSYQFVFRLPKVTTYASSGYASGGLGLARADWERQHGSLTESGPFSNVRFVDENVERVEYTWGDHNAVPLEAARSHAKLLMPHDAKLLRTYVPRKARLVDLYSSKSLTARFAPGDATWIGSKPGEFMVLYRVYENQVTSLIIAIGNNP